MLSKRAPFCVPLRHPAWKQAGRQASQPGSQQAQKAPTWMASSGAKGHPSGTLSTATLPGGGSATPSGNRIWIVGVSKALLSLSHISPDIATDFLQQIVNRMSHGNEMLQMDEILLPETDPAVQLHLSQCQQHCHLKSSSMDWMEKHIAVMGDASPPSFGWLYDGIPDWL